MTLPDDRRETRMIAHYSRVESLVKRLEHGFIVFNDEKKVFEKLKEIDLTAPLEPAGHPLRAKVDGEEYVYFPQPYPCVRAKADWKSVTDVSTYEALTCLAEGTSSTRRMRSSIATLAETAFYVEENTPPIKPQDLKSWSGREGEPRGFADAAGERGRRQPVVLHGGSVYWNDYRKRYIMIGLEVRAHRCSAKSGTPRRPSRTGLGRRRARSSHITASWAGN